MEKVKVLLLAVLLLLVVSCSDAVCGSDCDDGNGESVDLVTIGIAWFDFDIVELYAGGKIYGYLYLDVSSTAPDTQFISVPSNLDAIGTKNYNGGTKIIEEFHTLELVADSIYRFD